MSERGTHTTLSSRLGLVVGVMLQVTGMSVVLCIYVHILVRLLVAVWRWS